MGNGATLGAVDAAVAARIREAIDAAGASVHGTAEAANIPPSTLERWLNGGYGSPRISQLYAIARALDVQPVTLLPEPQLAAGASS
jgi:transcriptional regulator with XRE-family HTH domain